MYNAYNMRHGQNTIHKGHLAPAQTLSFDDGARRSTFVHTNAIPQFRAFNVGQWRVYEERIRTYARSICGDQGGTLYLMTGPSAVSISRQGGQIMGTFNQLGSFPDVRGYDSPNIRLPNSLWTAACCVKRDGTVIGAFGVIGNNVQVINLIMASAVTVGQLQDLLAVGEGVPNINLFPNNPDCSDPSKQYLNLANLPRNT